MASNSVCTACLRSMRQIARTELRTTQSLSTRLAKPSRAFSTSRNLTAAPSQASKSPIPASAAQTTPEPALAKFASKLRSMDTLSSATEPYVAYGATEKLFKICAVAGNYRMPPLPADGQKRTTAAGEELGLPDTDSWWYNHLTLLPIFNTWAQITFLHMYLLTVRLRMFPKENAFTWHQTLLDHFSYAAEDRMVTHHSIDARSVRNKYLKDLFVQWRGVMAAYDEGLIKGDAVLAAAVWRNLFQGKEDVDFVQVAEVTAWLRAGLRDMDGFSDREIATGEISFPDPRVVEREVALKAIGTDEQFVEATASPSAQF